MRHEGGHTARLWTWEPGMASWWGVCACGDGFPATRAQAAGLEKEVVAWASRPASQGQVAGSRAGRRIAITGGREHEPLESELVAFLRLWRREGGTVLIHGDARGVDRIVGARAEARGIEVRRVPVDTAVDGPWPAAGQVRNRRMLVQERAELLVAFPGDRGTAGCCREALRLGLPVWRWSEVARDFLLAEKTS